MGPILPGSPEGGHQSVRHRPVGHSYRVWDVQSPSDRERFNPL